jgi:S1-C subfamily serine protease
MRYRTSWIVIILLVSFTGCSSTQPSVKLHSSNAPQIPVGALLETDSSGKTAEAAEKGVVRVICRSTSYGGTGFLHKSGLIITAAHVVSGCATSDLLLVTSSGRQIGVASVSVDDVKDLAIIRPSSSIPGSPLVIAPVSEPQLGAQVTTWGYPGGYDGLIPLLSVGYFAGVQDFTVGTNNRVRRWVINAAFNGGNSGGPVFSVQDGQVIGVVTSKLAPLPEVIATIIEDLNNDRGGFFSGRSRVRINGQQASESQLVGVVLQYLRTQVQLVIGYTVTTKDLNDFLKEQGIAP